MVLSGTIDGGINPINLPVTGLLDHYRIHLETSNKRPKTIKWYLDILYRFFDFLELSNLMKPVDELGKEALEAYIIHRKATKRWPNNPHIKEENKGELSPYSIHGDVRAIKAFWGWLLYQGYVENNALAKFPLPKVPKTLIKTLTIEQIRLLLKTIDKNTPVGDRNYCILVLMIDNGMRISEAKRLRSFLLLPHRIAAPPVAEVTSSVGMVRFHGRNAANWEKKGISGEERFNYLYSVDELRAWVPDIWRMVGQAEKVHIIFKNKSGDFPVRNAREFTEILE